jgi:cyclopropane-fatty-acyl-phospholipid synthase
MPQDRVLTLELLDELFSPEQVSEVGFRLWDGSRWPDENDHRATIVLNHPGALRRMFLPGTEVGLAEAYLYDDFDIEGEAEAVFGWQESLAEIQDQLWLRLTLGWRLLQLPRNGRAAGGQRGPANLEGERHSVERDRQAVTYHYDVSNDFYQLYLDKRMVYSCGYFHTPQDSLDQAQAQKLDHICRKLRLRPGQWMLDIGCGWGGLVIYSAKHYQVQVVGITLSQPQAELANERITEQGLQDRCQVKVLDYRELDDPEGFDVMASVGMFEHVGEAKLPAYFKQAFRLLKPGGLFLNHGITRRATDPPDPAGSFSDSYVFPDGELTPISTSLRVAEETGFEVRDVESLREHYAMTLRRWVENLEGHHEEALQYVDEPTYRVWRLFMSGSAYGFSHGRLNLHQALLAKPEAGGHVELPLTRADLYENGG